MKIVKIQCVDMAYNTSSWELKLPLDFGLVKVTIVGYLVEDKPNCIIIAKEHWEEENQVRHLTAIPKACIISQEEIE